MKHIGLLHSAHILEKEPSDLRHKTTSHQLSHFILYLNIFYLIQKIDTLLIFTCLTLKSGTNTHIVNLDAWPWVSLRRKRRRRGRRKRWIPPRRSNQGTINIKRGRGGGERYRVYKARPLRFFF